MVQNPYVKESFYCLQSIFYGIILLIQSCEYKGYLRDLLAIFFFIVVLFFGAMVGQQDLFVTE